MAKISDFDAFFKSKKNANCILELEKSLLSDNDDCILSSLDVFKDVITKIFQKGMMPKSPNQDEAEEKFRLWLISCYNDFVSHLVDYLVHENCKIQEKSLDTLMVLVSLEGGNSNKEGWFFPNDLFQKIISALVSSDFEQQSLITKFEQYTCYDDIKTYLLKAILKLFQDTEKVTDVFLGNAYCLLNTLEYPKEFTEESNSFLSQKEFVLKKKLFCKLFSSVWAQFLKFTLPPALLRDVLLSLHENVLPHLSNPCLMTDFLTDAYKQGGELSLLSLNGLFYLIDKHNVEYPDFWVKLYSLFDHEIMNGKFNKMFFSLSDFFLSSRHLPAYLVAAFVKRLARLSYFSKPEVILCILPFVFNLLIRNPILECLVHRNLNAETDPFDIFTENPAECKALDSSLWEIKNMQNHYLPEIATTAKIINHKLPTVEFNFSQVIDTALQTVYKKERKRKITNSPTAVCKPSKIHSFRI